MADPDRRRWREAGLMHTETNRLGRNLDPFEWWSPAEMWLDDGNVCWSSDPAASRTRVVAPIDLLDRFTKLWAASDEAIAGFAAEYGVMWLCQDHGLPISHARGGEGAVFDPVLKEPIVRPCKRLGDAHPYMPCDWYRTRARQARAMLNIAACLEQGVPGAAEDWSVVSLDYAEAPDMKYPGWKPVPLTRHERLQGDQETLGEVLDRWLDLFDVRLRIEWYRTPKPDCRLTATNLMGAIVASLVLAIARVDGYVFCSACGRPYAPKRRPRANDRNYCPNEECQKAKGRYATRNYQQKKKAAGQ